MAVNRNWHNLRELLRKTYNREVNEWFRDVPDDFPDNSTSRKNAKRACLVLPRETQNMALLKTLTFRYVVQRTHLRPHVYGTPIGSFDKVRRYRPQIVLEFREDELDIEPGYSPLDGRISFRLMNEDSETITNTELTTIARRIKTEFGGSTEYIWRKGKDLASYVDKNKGYQFQLLVRSKEDAKELITKVINCNADTPNFKYLSYKESDSPTEAYPTLPGNLNVLGEVVKQPRVRPISSVRFRTAYCNIWGKNDPVILYDRSFTYLNPLITDNTST
jgi:hypothetical protein